MSAIIKTIPIHSSSVNPLMKYCANQQKTSLSKNLKENPDINVSAALDYAANPLKTICSIDENHKEILTTGIKCNPSTAAQEFAIAKQKYREMTGNNEIYEPFEYVDKKTGEVKTVQRQAVTAIHMIQSFAEKDLDPHVVHQMGVELMERLGFQGVVDTHLNKDHLHNHLIINVYKGDGTKWNCNLEERLRVREISDEIQREYGIEIGFDNPREQQVIAYGKNYNYKEWAATEDGLSWKDQMKQDIINIRNVAKNKEDYLSMMEAYGYSVYSAKEKTITFITEDGKKINDKTLGKEFTTSQLFPDEPENELKYRVIPLERQTISVARYNADGSRRGFLEMLLRKAIAAIQKLSIFWKEDDFVFTTYTPKNKIDKLNEAIDIVKDNNLKSKDDLEVKLDETGKQLSHVKAEVRHLEEEEKLYQDLSDAISTIETLRQVKTHIGDLDLHTYTPEEIRKNKAKRIPLTPSEKSAIAVAFHDHPEYKLDCKYHELTPSEARAILDFLDGTTEEKPALVMETSEYDKKSAINLANKIYNSRYEMIDKKYGKTPADEQTIQSCQKILAAHGIDKELKGLTQAEAIDIRNCFMANPFTSPLINQEQQNALLGIVQKRGMQLNRPINYVTEKEATIVLNYLKAPDKMQMPSILKPIETPRENDLYNAERLMEARGVKFTVPLRALSKADFDKAYTYLISMNQEPKYFQPKEEIVLNQDRDNWFNEHIEEYHSDKIMYLTQYRDALNTLRAYGYEVDAKSDLDEIKHDIEEWEKKHEEIVEHKDNLSMLYHDLMKAKSIISKAEDPEFVYGKKKEKQVEIEIKETEERETKEQEEKEQKENEERKKERNIVKQQR